MEGEFPVYRLLYGVIDHLTVECQATRYHLHTLHYLCVCITLCNSYDIQLNVSNHFILLLQLQASDSVTLASSVSRLTLSDPRQDVCDVSHLHHSQAVSVPSPTPSVPSPPAFPCDPAPTLTELSLQVPTQH